MKKILSMLMVLFLLAGFAGASFDSIGFTSNSMPVDMLGQSYLVEIDGNSSSWYMIDFDGTESDVEYNWTTGTLYLVDYVGPSYQDLYDYYDTKPDTPYDFRGYLQDALDGNNPFAYMVGGQDGMYAPVNLYDAAMHDLLGTDVPLRIDGDFPCGKYIVETSDGEVRFSMILFGPLCTNVYELGKSCLVAEDTAASTWTLLEDCETDETIYVPDGYTFYGEGYTITAVDPDAGHFTGAVIMNGGDEANILDLGIMTMDLANVCDGGDDRLRGIMLDGASGAIMNNNIMSVNQGVSGCQEGNGIEVRNAPFDGTHPDTKMVVIKDNMVMDWQKTGIIANGDVEVMISNNNIGQSFSDKYYLAPNTVQLAYGAKGTVEHNNLEGSSWCGNSEYVGTAMLLYNHEDGTIIRQNNIRGDSDIGIYNYGGETWIDNNKVFEDKDALNCNVYYPESIGIGNWGDESEVTNNKVKGFDIAYDGVVGGKNKIIQGPQHSDVFW